MLIFRATSPQFRQHLVIPLTIRSGFRFHCYFDRIWFWSNRADMTCNTAAMQSSTHVWHRRVPYNQAVQAGRVPGSHVPIRTQRAHRNMQRRGYRKTAVCIFASAAKSNPQNVPGPQVVPSKDFSASETVEAQLNALRENNQPWPNHGLMTMYEFGETIGGLERCYYFGHGKDLYHFDHFMGQFQNAYPELMYLSSYAIEGTKFEEDVHKVLVKVTSGVNSCESRFVFILAVKDVGTKKGALMTRCLIRHQTK